MVEPRYEHDCEECQFLTRYAGRDIYRCPQMGNPTIVARYGSDGAEYESGPLLWVKRAGEADAQAIGFEATPDFAKVHNADGIYRLGSRIEIALSPATALLIEGIPEDLRLHPTADESFDRLAGEAVIDDRGMLAARISGDIRSKIRAEEPYFNELETKRPFR